jgi:hypothetical protein
MNGLYEAAGEIKQFCDERGWQFCFIGGLALVRWGEIRQTQDVDLTLLTRFDDARFIDELLSSFKPRFVNARDFAVQNRVVLLTASNAVPIDVSLGALPFEEGMIRRATGFAYLPDCNLPTASAEDLIVMKCFAGRTKDWADVEGILARQSGKKLKWKLILSELTALCELKETPETVDQLLKLRQQFYAD